jgi:transaldolase
VANSSEAIGQTTTPGKRPHSKILVDGGDPQETARIQQQIGFVDGQTTNPSLIAKNPEIMHWLSRDTGSPNGKKRRNTGRSCKQFRRWLEMQASPSKCLLI